MAQGEPASVGTDPRAFLREAEPKRLLDFLVGRAAMAPSPYNSQPWRFRSKDPAVVDLQWDPERWLARADPEGRLLYVALGAALENFLVAARDLGFAPELDWFPDGEGSTTAVRIQLGRPGELGEPDPRVDMQARRRTAHGPLTGPLEPSVRDAVDGMAMAGVTLAWAEGEWQEALAGHAAETASHQWRDPAFREELVAWLRKDRGELEVRRDGMALTRFRRFPGWLAKGLRRAMVRLPGLFDPQARTARRIRRAPALVVLATPEGNGRRQWLEVGRAYQRLGVELARWGHALGPEAALTATEEARSETGRLMRLEQPQLVARIGRARPHPGTPRRKLHRVLNPPAPTFPLYPHAD
jgi:nitroreductase